MKNEERIKRQEKIKQQVQSRIKLNRSKLRRIESNYAETLKSINRQLYRRIRNLDNTDDIIKVLKHIAQSTSYNRHCEAISMQMVTMLNGENHATWRIAARQGSKGREVYLSLMQELKSNSLGNIIERQIYENAKYIKTLPTNIAFEVNEFIKAETIKGTRASEMVEYIKTMFPEKSVANANLIARTEISKTQSALTEARAKDLGLNWYIWRTSEDSRVRSSHELMDGILVKWSDPPSPEALLGKKSYGKYHAGNFPNCRCYSEPVVSWNYVEFPCKVYFNGKIEKMAKQNFMQKFNISA